MKRISKIDIGEKKSIIQKLDEISFWKCKDIKIGTALCAVLTLHKNWNEEKYIDLKSQLSSIGKYKMQFDKELKNALCFVLSSYNISRIDQTEMFDSVTELFEDKYVVKAIKDRKSLNDVKWSIILLWLWQMRKLKIALLQKKIILLYMYLYYSEACRLFSEINKRKNHIKMVAVFDDIFPIDNMVAQMCKNVGLKTATFHHAIINGSYKYIEYRYSVTDYFLAWGNYTRDIAVYYGMDRNKIRVLGPINKIGEKRQIAKSTDKKVFGVLTRGTDEERYVDENIDMIHIAGKFARKYGYNFILRLHPSDAHIRDYMKHVDKGVYVAGNRKDTLLDFLEKVEFSICANTSAYAESIYYGKMCYRYIPKYEEKIDVCKGISFGKISNLEQLETKFKKYSTQQNIDKMMERVSDYIFEKNVENNYRNFFMSQL